MEIKRGRFFVLDGPDSTGKATQTKIIHRELSHRGFNVEILDFPQYGKNLFADMVTAYLGGEFGNPIDVNPYLSSLAYAADRAKIAPYVRGGISKGVIFLANRYVSSNIAHQGAKITNPQDRNKFFDWEYNIEYTDQGFNIPRPDLCILLDVDTDVSSALASARVVSTGIEKDGHERDDMYLATVAQVYREIAAMDPTWRVFNCSPDGKMLSRNQITKGLFNIIEPFLPRL